MEWIENPADEKRGMFRYQIGSDQKIYLEARYIEAFGLTEAMYCAEIDENEMPTKRVPVLQDGREIGALPPNFDLAHTRFIAKTHVLRTADLRWTGNRWDAHSRLRPSGFERISGFLPLEELRRNAPR